MSIVQHIDVGVVMSPVNIKDMIHGCQSSRLTKCLT